MSAANFNARDEIVVAGHTGAVARVEPASSPPRKERPSHSKVSAPFHCALMAPAARLLAEDLGAMTVGPLAFPIVANVSGTPNGDAACVKDLLVRQVDGAVRWEETVRFMSGAGVDRALEIGPGKVLAGAGQAHREGAQGPQRGRRRGARSASPHSWREPRFARTRVRSRDLCAPLRA